jgi:hypothetical protein
MTRNPILNALAAVGYIVVVASIVFYGPTAADDPDTVIVPITMISLFTLSAAVMGYIFLSQPLRLYLDGKKQAAVSLFIRTVVIFAGVTALLLLALFSGIFT